MTDVVFNITNPKFYLKNPLLKAKGVNIEWTPELIEEYLKCKNDPIYFIETYMKIINVDEGLINFKLRDYQKDLVETVLENGKTCAVYSRQVGKSTTVCGFILHYILFNSEKTVAILANKEATAIEIMSRVQLAYQYIPHFLQQGVGEWNKKSIVLENNSRVLAAATSSSAIRGYSVNLLVIDEAAHIENWDEFFTSVYPTISSGKTTKTVLISTPNGLNHFFKIVSEAKSGKNDFKVLEAKWDVVPGRDQKWKEDEMSILGKEKFTQEHEIEFLGSSSTLIAGWKLKDLIKEGISTPHFISEDKDFRIYKEPQPNRIYTTVVDTSRGVGGDYSAFIVVDITEIPYEIVATFRNNKISPQNYPSVIYEVSKKYNEAYVLPETNDIGAQVADILWDDLEYEQILKTIPNGRAGLTIASPDMVGKTRGVRTTSSVKRIGCLNFKTLVEEDKLIVNDENLISELTKFEQKGVSYEASEGNDDLTMCGVLFSWMSIQPHFKELSDLDMRLELSNEYQTHLENQILPFGFIDDGQPEDENEAKVIRYDEFTKWLLS